MPLIYLGWPVLNGLLFLNQLTVAVTNKIYVTPFNLRKGTALGAGLACQ